MTVDPVDLASIARLLEASGAMIVTEVRALGDLARWRPASGEWCANEVLGHVIEAEQRGFAGRIRILLTEPAPSFEGWDQPGVAAARRDCERDPEELIATFAAVRQDSLALVRGLRVEELSRGGNHNVVGWLTTGDIVAEWVHHDRNHLRQILANSQARVWPQMGSARRFSSPTD